ncbi:MAG: hypothetical protein KGZ88_02195 [Methylomicrobium sp.]|nr:hypothetical protein [Methylomicrobium sp.]
MSDLPVTDDPSFKLATHHAFGLRWHFPFEFSAFTSATDACIADVMVEFAHLPTISADPENQGRLSRVDANEVIFMVEGVATFQVCAGRWVRLHPEPGSDTQMMKLILMGAVAAFVLHQRGLLPLHGSGIVTPQGARLFVGHSGAGKSTTLAALVKRGYPMICDDLASICLEGPDEPSVFPGVPLYKLWADSAEALGLATDVLPRVREQLDKFIVSAAGGRQVADSIPLHTIYQLEVHDQPQVSFEELHNAAKFHALLDHTWQNLTLKRMGLHKIHFQQLVSLSNRVRVVAVRRPREGTETGILQLIERLEADFQV